MSRYGWLRTVRGHSTAPTGLIVCTPTGSTAYLALGRRADHVSLGFRLCITPICPHMLTYRPVLVPDDMDIHITSRAEDETAWLNDRWTGR